jgi:hypothetical protein
LEEQDDGREDPEWLGRLFEFEDCPDCGGDAQDHEVRLVSGIGIDFARCRRSLMGDGSDDMGDPGRAAGSDLRRAADRRE